MGYSDTIRIIEAEERHAGACAKLLASGTDVALRPFAITAQEGYREFVRQQIKASGRGGEYRYWIALRHEEVVAVAEYRILGTVWFLNNIDVAPGLVGNGIGSILLRQTIPEGRRFGCTHLSLDVLSHNLRVVKWYGRLGLKEISRSAFVEYEIKFNEDAGYGVLNGIPQANIVHSVLGFSELTVRGNSVYRIGLIGEEWYRSTDISVLRDNAALSIMSRYSPSRRLILVCEYGDMKEAGGTVCAELIRMEAPLGDLVD